MICRRCGMESATTDVCEWCKKPILPEGSAISVKAKEQLLEERAQAEARGPAPEPGPEPPRPAADGEMAPARPGLRPPSQPPIHESGLVALGANLAEDTQETPLTFVTEEVNRNDTLLRPLGTTATSQGEGSRDLSAETARYIGNEQSIFRPMVRPRGQTPGQWAIDPTTGRRRRVGNEEPEVPDNVRLRRALPYGAIVAFAMAFIEFIAFRKVPTTIATLRLPGLAAGSNVSIINALVYGFYCTVLLAFMAALLVNRRWGAPAGFLVGLVIGYVTLGSGQEMPIVIISLVAGAFAGVLIGKVAVKGVRRVISV